MANRRIHTEILWVKGSTYINTKLTIYYKCILTEIWRHLCFRMPFSWTSTECVEQVKNVEKKVERSASWERQAPSVNVTYITLPVSQHSMSFCEKENQKNAITKHQYLKTWKIRFLQASDLQDLTSFSIVHVHGPSHCYISSRKPFYDLLPVSNKQTSFMPMEASAFVNTKARTCGQLLLHCDHRDELWPTEQIAFFVTSQISTRLRRSRHQVTNPVVL